MSDSQKQERQAATPIKNPLLSASVTGLTFDDYPNKPLLLPAAPHVVHSPVPAPVITSSGLVTREPKSLVTVGSSSLDTEGLDEINLNSSNEDNQTTDITDPNANLLLEQLNQGVNSDSILSQAASSFSALPSVASNVFSTFSKRITSISSRETTPTYDHYQPDSNANALAPQIAIQPSYIPQYNQGDLAQAPPPFYAPPLGVNTTSSISATSSQQDTQTNLHSPEPPKFYTPADVPPVPSISTAPPANLGGQNNFRFSSKKKVYAPVPGLSDQTQRPATTLDTSAGSHPISYDTTPAEITFHSQYSTSEDRKTEERKAGSGLFSKISNLAPSGVLQNITGLVQSATGSLTQTNKTEGYQQTVFDQQSNYFAVPPPPTNYFIPPSLGGQQTNTESPLTRTEHTNAPNIQALFSGQQSENSNFFTPQSITATSLQPPNLSSAATTATSQTEIPLFNSLNASTQINTSSLPQPPLLPPSEQSVAAYFNSNQSFPIEPSKFSPLSGQAGETSQSSLTSNSLPPSVNYKVPPPASGPTSYRLQKGTKLYKSPLTPQETAPIPATPHQVQAINQSSKQSLITLQSVPLNTSSPAVAAESVHSQSVSLFAPAEELKQTTQSVALFAPPPPSPIVSESLTSKSAHNIPLFTPTVEELKSKDASQSIPLYYPSYNPVQRKSSLASQSDDLKTKAHTTVSSAPPTKKLKSDESVLDDLKLTAPIENTNSIELKTNEAEQSAGVEVNKPLESVENIFVTYVPEPGEKSNPIDSEEETQPIFEPIEPIFEKNLTEIQNETIGGDPLEETLQKLSLTSKTNPAKLPSITESFNLNNPYRKGSASEKAKPAPPLPTLANFFAPAPTNSSADLNFFATLPATQSTSGNEINFFSETSQDKEYNKENFEPIPLELTTPLEPDTAVHPPISAFFPKLPTSLGLVPAILKEENDITKQLNESYAQEKVPPPIGFEGFTQLEPTAPLIPDNTVVHQIDTTVQQETTTTTQTQTQQPEIVKRFSNYFNQSNQQSEIPKDPSTFFDSFPGQQQLAQQPQQQKEVGITVSSVATNEEQRIQYFFNNPPPKDASAVGDLNYDLVHSGLGIKNLQQRSLTPISNLVEPPSSACSEFSEISNSTAGQKSIAANLSITESSEKLIEKEESVIEEQNSSNTKHYKELPEEILKELRMANLLSADKAATATPVASVSYKPAVKHWFFKRTIGDKHVWVPFSHYDSALLETSLIMECDANANIVAVEGGRYDVNIKERKKMSVYWDSQPIEVRRCSWFYKAVDSKYVPYEEQTAEILESEYKQAAESGVWHKTIILGMGEQVVFHGPTVIVHFQQQQNSDAWGGTTQTATRPRVVKRDLDDFNIEQGESQKVDHLLFMVHGIGSACDLKLRSVEEVVEDFRTIARQLVQSHYKNSTDLGLVGRVEVLPISWHSHLHSVEMGIDEKLRMITLESIPKLRNFTNDTLLDILFYTSPTYCQKIMNTIVASINSLYLKYRERHPEFNGGASLAGHSLGSLILFDLLCHQNPIKESEENNTEKPEQFSTQNLANAPMDSNQLEDKQISYTMGPAGTGQPFISYGQLIFQPKKFFALGSPIGMFVTIRGIDKLGLDFRLPTCSGFYNIFHPYDPVAYRIEALVNPDLSGVRPVLIPHHKGRKRMHLELKETMARVSMDLKNRFLDKFKTTLDSVNIFGSTSKCTKEAEELMEKEVDKVIQMQMQLEQQNHNKTSNDNLPSVSENPNESYATHRQRTDSVSTAMSDDAVEIDFPLGKLNDSKRIDYVLQEAPLEFINEYIFALSSHVCYWDSEDTILFVMKEIYAGLGITPDSQVPQQTMTIERPSSLLFMFL